MPMQKRAAAMRPFFLAALALLPLAADAATYKWRDRNGRLMFTQVPPASGTPYEVIGGAPPPANAPNQDALNQSLQKSQREEPQRRQAAEQAAAIAEARQKNCIGAIERLAFLDANPPRRLAVTDPQGNVARMSEEEHARQRAEVQERMAQNCD